MRIEIKDKENFINLFNDLFNNHKINKINGITIDSRKIKKDDIYIPLKGNIYDGNDYVNNALKSGAIKCFSERDFKNKNIINIKSSIDLINKMAKSWNDISKHKIIAITGSNGKTTTKDLIFHIICKNFSCSKSVGNFNSKVGLPLSYLNSNINEDYCILEYGANQKNEIQYLCNIIKPNYSVITNISNSHIENFKTLENIFKTKKAILSTLNKNETAFINIDDQYISKIKINCNKITFGFNSDAKYFAKKNKNLKNYTLEINDKIISLPKNLQHLEKTILIAYAIAKELGMSHNDINKYLQTFKLPKGRGESIEIERNVILIDDCYNANPASVLLAIKRFNDLIIDGKKIFIFADMLELGSYSKKEHIKVAEILDNTKIDIVITFGNHSHSTYLALKNKSIHKKHFYKIEELKTYFKKLINKGDSVYLKGSRSMQLERLYN